MLLQFTVGNYRSFRERTTFSLMAEPKEVGHLGSLLSVSEDSNGPKALSLAALYGANASGKSNLLKAIEFLRRLVVDGTRPGQAIPVDRFLLNGKQETPPSFFEAYFSCEGTIYSYGVECNVRTIYREWLRVGFDDIPLFTRTTDGDKITVEISDSLREIEPSVTDARWDFIAEGTRSNQPFITQFVEQNGVRLYKIWKWFHTNLVVVWPDSNDSYALVNMAISEQHINGLSAFLQAADTGITQIELSDEEFDLAQLSDQLRQEADLNFFNAKEGQAIYLTFLQNGERITIRRDNKTGKTARVKLQATHKGRQGSTARMDWSTESDGTRRMAELWQILFMYQASDRTLIVDEIERSLHPELMRFIIEQWRELAPPNCQLIFTTHNDNFLEDDLLRRDEVWFIEKDRSGGTRMTSETEFKPIEGVTRQRAYLDGMYGGTPRISSRRFHWVDRKEKL